MFTQFKIVDSQLRLLNRKAEFLLQPFNSPDLISNSPNCLPNDSHYLSLENLVSDQLVLL